MPVSISGSEGIGTPAIEVAGSPLLGVASQAETEAGTATDKLMTPLRTAQSITTSRVLEATAGAAFGAVGTYAWVNQSGSNVAALEAGSTYSGSNLRAGGIWSGSTALAENASTSSADFWRSNTALSGTWRAMGTSRNTATNNHWTLALRIS
jgi:hypothetical protein